MAATSSVLVTHSLQPAAPLVDRSAHQVHRIPSPPVARHIPEFKRQEHSPDPFKAMANQTSGPPPTSTWSLADVHPQKGIALLYILVAWLHLQHHLPFRACNALVGVVMLIIRAFAQVVEPQPLTTLPRILSSLDVEPSFTILPICPGCLELYPRSPSTPDLCNKCNTSMFKTTSPVSSRSRSGSGHRVPLLQFAHKTIQSQLKTFLSSPGSEQLLDEWRQKTRYAGRYQDIFDGAVTKSLLDHEGRVFFRNGTEDRGGPNGELRIGLTLGVDWCAPRLCSRLRY